MAWVIAVVLVAIRLGVLFYATPFDAIGRLPVQIRIYATLVFAVVLVGGLGIGVESVPESVGALITAGLYEVLVGLLMAFGLYCAFGSIMVGGKLLDFQAGFGAAQLLNPSTNTASPLIGSVISLLAVVVFFLSDAYQLALRGISYSLQISPPGSGVGEIAFDRIVAQFGVTYVYGLIIAGPVLGILMLLDTGSVQEGNYM